MSNVQFISLLSTAIGSFVLVILAWIHQNQRLSDLRMDMSQQFADARADTNRQFTDTRADTNRQFADVQRQFTDVQRQFTEVRGSLATLTEDYQRFYGMEQKLEGRVDELSKRVA